MVAPVFATDDVPSAEQVNEWFVNVLHKRVPTAQQVTSSTTLQDDDYLFLDVDSNAEYVVTCMLTYGGSSSADIKVLFRVPTGGNFIGMGVTLIPGAGGQQDVQSLPVLANASDAWGCIGSGQQYGIVHGVLTTSATAGTFKVEWAQNVSSATPTQVFAGSYLTLRRVG